MHFSIPDTKEVRPENGPVYVAYNIHINGAFHCTLRYKQLHSLNEQLKKEYGAYNLPSFPPKKFLTLTQSGVEERRGQLEKYIQAVSQDAGIVSGEVFSGFFLRAQQETRNIKETSVDLEVHLMNWQKVPVHALNTASTSCVLELVTQSLNLPSQFAGYFGLYLVHKRGGTITVVRWLQDFDSPVITKQSLSSDYYLVIRKSYWDSSYDLDLLEDRVATHLLYVQALSEIEHGWIKVPHDKQRNFAALQASGNKAQFVREVQSFTKYGYLHFPLSYCDYLDADVAIAIGGRELIVISKDGQEFIFRVTRIRCWRITALIDDGDTKSRLELSFEYLMNKDELKWVTLVSSQAILMSICLQGMVDELLLKNTGPPRLQASGRRGSWSYMNRDGSSHQISRSVSADTFLSNGSVGANNLKSPDTSSANFPFSKTYRPKSKHYKSLLTKPLVENDAFEGIGDDDL